MSSLITEPQPTDEQIEARRLFLDGRNLKINAYAGTGKTHTLKLLAEARSGPSLYLAFNKDIVTASDGQFPTRVKCKTTHAMAMAFVRSQWSFTKTKLEGSAKPREIATFLGLPRHKDFDLLFGKPHDATQLAVIVRETVFNFLNSPDDNLAALHVPDEVSSSLLSEEEQVAKQQEIADFTLPYAKRLWEQMCTTSSAVPLGPSGYFKLWTLGGHQLPFDCVYLDEAQDSNPPLLELLGRQSCQVVYVGDPYQAIYGFRGAMNAMTKVQTNNVSSLTTCFRFGQTIADAAFQIIRTIGATEPLRGNPDRSSRLSVVSQPDCIIARTNLSLFTELANREHEVEQCCIGERQRGKLILSLDDVKLLKQSKRALYTEDLRGYKSWDDVQDHVRRGRDAQLNSFCNVVQHFGEDRLRSLVSRSARTRAESKLSLTTAHCSKGQQWDKVLISDDFCTRFQRDTASSSHVTESKRKDADEETRLLYVAVTRAREEVQIPAFLRQHFGMNVDNQSRVVWVSTSPATADVETKPGLTINVAPAFEEANQREVDVQSQSSAKRESIAKPGEALRAILEKRRAQVISQMGTEAKRGGNPYASSTPVVVIPPRSSTPVKGVMGSEKYMRSTVRTKSPMPNGRDERAQGSLEVEKGVPESSPTVVSTTSGSAPIVQSPTNSIGKVLWQVNQRVKHANWGYGTISAIVPVASKDRYGQRVTVVFDIGESFTFALQLVKLELLS